MGGTSRRRGDPGDQTHLGDAVLNDDEYIGMFTIASGDKSVEVDAWSNTIESDNGEPLFRLVALAKTGQGSRLPTERDKQLLRDKDVCCASSSTA